MNHDQHEALGCEIAARVHGGCVHVLPPWAVSAIGILQQCFYNTHNTHETPKWRQRSSSGDYTAAVTPRHRHVSRAHAMEAHKRPNRRPKRPAASRATPPAGPRAAQPVWTPAVPPRDRKLANRAAHARPRPLLAVLVSPSPTDLAARKRHRRWNSQRRSTCHGYRGCRNTVSNAAGHAVQATGR